MNEINLVKKRILDSLVVHPSLTWDDLDCYFAPLAERIAGMEANIEWRREQFYILSACVGRGAEAIEALDKIAAIVAAVKATEQTDGTD